MLDEDKSLPNLIVVDGGKGQLSSAVKSLKRLNLFGKIPIIGIAKRLEEIFFPGDNIPLYLDKNSSTLKVIQHIRNESHRFGINFHRDLRSKELIKTELDQIKGIGPKTIEMLLTEFKSVKNIRLKTLNEIANIIGLSKAKNVYEYFLKQRK